MESTQTSELSQYNKDSVPDLYQCISLICLTLHDFANDLVFHICYIFSKSKVVSRAMINLTMSALKVITRLIWVLRFIILDTSFYYLLLKLLEVDLLCADIVWVLGTICLTCFNSAHKYDRKQQPSPVWEHQSTATLYFCHRSMYGLNTQGFVLACMLTISHIIVAGFD